MTSGVRTPNRSELELALARILAPGGGPGEAPPGACLGLTSPSGRQLVAGGSRQVLGSDEPLLMPTPLPMTTDVAFDLGSVTKVVATTTALMTLVDRGELHPSDRLGRFLPGCPTPLAEVALDDLLLHRAGLWEWWPLYLRTRTHAETVAAATGLPLRHPAGSRRAYSDLGFLLLGEVVARVADESVADAVRRLVLQPWGLAETGYGGPVRTGTRADGTARPGPIAASSVGDRIERTMIETGEPYPVDGSTTDFPGWRTRVLVGEVNDGNAYHGCGGAAGHAGLFGTVADLLTFADQLLDCLDGSGPVRPEVVRSFLAEGPDAGQARGFQIGTSSLDDCAATVFSHPGFPGVSVGVLPKHRAGLVVATNRLHVSGRPRPHAVAWEVALAAAHRHLHRESRSRARRRP